MAEPMTDGQFTCETCKFCGTSAAMPPCNTCPRSMQDKWEPKTPEPKPWPVGPFKVLECSMDLIPDWWRVVDGIDDTVANCEEEAAAEAIALALNMLPECVAWVRAADFPDFAAFAGKRDALLAKIDAAGFKMPEAK